MRKSYDKARLFPVLLTAAVFLIAFKIAGLIFNSGQNVAAVAPAHAQDKKTTNANPPEAKAKPAKTPKDSPKETAKRKSEPGNKAAKGKDKSKATVRTNTSPRSAETRILRRLTQRRQVLEKRAKALELRENLIKAAEQQIEERIRKLKIIGARIEQTLAKQDKTKKARLKGLVSMYENMKPKDAARIFNRLDLTVMIDIAEQMNTRKMSPVLALMDAAAAERLTLELVARARGRAQQAGKNKLPKVRPGGAG